MFITIVIALVSLIVVLKSVIVVPAEGAWVVERLGRYDRTLPAGTHVLAPFIDRVAFRYSLAPVTSETSDVCITGDNVPVRVTSTVSAQIVDARQAAYATGNAGDFVTTLVRTQLRQWIGGRSWDDVRATTSELGVATMQAAEEPASRIGVRMLAVDVNGIERVEAR